MCTELKIINISENGKTNFEDGTCWYSFKATMGEKSIQSFCIIREDLSLGRIVEEIAAHILKRGFDNFPNISAIPPYLNQLIQNCHASEEDLWLVEGDDDTWNAFTQEQKEQFKALVHQYNLEDYIRFDEEGIDILVYGGISTVIDFTTPTYTNPVCYTHEKEIPSPLCIGNSSGQCAICCLWVDYQ